MAAAIRVLYVDDESALLVLCRLFLERSGDFTVTIATSAPEAIRMLEKERFDAIVSDYQMPEMNGIEFLKTVRATDKSIPFLIFTGKGREEIAIEAFENGADFYLQKGGEPKSQFAELSHKIKKAVDRKQTGVALRESEDRFQHAFEDTIIGMAIMAPDGHLMQVNRAMCAMLEYTKSELIGKNFRAISHFDDLLLNTDAVMEILSGSQDVINFEKRFLRKNGEVVWGAVNSILIHDSRGLPLYFITHIQDITERKQAEEALRLANKKLTLLSKITRHDIKNQLTVILGYMDMLERKQFDPIISEYFQMVATAAKQISAIIRFTREYEKVGITAPVWQDCRTLVDTAAKEAPLGQVMMKNEIPAGTEVFADLLIVRVCYNLMDNAVRYGGNITTIRFSVEESGDNHLIVCEDDGVGVTAEEKEKIFERGYGKNTGLGLALSREILAITDITIRETGVPGKGARFEMIVPKEMYRVIGTG